MEHISGEFNRGYSAAIQDITEIFESVRFGLNQNKKHFNDKLTIELLKFIMENRAKIRENNSGFIRWNVTTQEFEYYKSV